MNDKNIFNIIDNVNNLKLEDAKNFLINECGYTDISLEALSDTEVIKKAEIKRVSKSLIKKYHKVYEALAWKH